MLSSLTYKKAGLFCGLVLSIAAAAEATPNVGAIYELDAVSTNDPAGVISNNSQTVTLSTPGSAVTVGLYLDLPVGADTTPADYGGQSVMGSFVGPSTGVLGNFRGDTSGTTPTQTNVATGFTGSGSQSGFLFKSTSATTYNIGQDVTVGTATATSSADASLGANGDAFIAVSNNGTSTSNPTWNPGTVQEEVTIGSTVYIKELVGETTYTLLSTDASGNTTLVFVPHLPSTGSAATKRNQIFEIGGNNYAVNASGSGFENGTTSVSGELSEQGLTVDLVPEPGSLGLIALSGLVLMRRRRRTSASI